MLWSGALWYNVWYSTWYDIAKGSYCSVVWYGLMWLGLSLSMVECGRGMVWFGVEPL